VTTKKLARNKSITLRIPRGSIVLPDKGQWIHRFHIKSETSDRLYTVAQHAEKRHWGCSCPAWRTRRYCKHLKAIGIPCYEKPFEARLEK